MTQQSLSFGLKLRDTALINMKAGKHSWLIEVAKQNAEMLIKFNGKVTVDDVRQIIEHDYEEYLKANYVDRRIFGAVFRDKRFHKVGYKSTSRSGSHGRPIAVFELA